MSPDVRDLAALVRPDPDDIRTLERGRLLSLVSRDMALAWELHAEDYQLIPPGGQPISREEYLGMIERGEFTYEVFEPESEIVVRLHPEVAVVRYRARIAARWGDGTDRGLFWHTDLYERRAGVWQAVWSQATRSARDA
jgi:hypothetical protein